MSHLRTLERLLIFALVLAPGCFTVPSDHRLQASGQPRPESLIGHGGPIEYGSTTIRSAADTISRVTGSRRVEISDDARHFAMPFKLSVGTRVQPLVDTVAEAENRWLILEVDEQDVVVGSRTSAVLPQREFGYWPRDSAMNRAADPLARQRLIDAKMLLTEQQYDAIDRAQQRLNRSANDR